MSQCPTNRFFRRLNRSPASASQRSQWRAATSEIFASSPAVLTAVSGAARALLEALHSEQCRRHTSSVPRLCHRRVASERTTMSCQTAVAVEPRIRANALKEKRSTDWDIGLTRMWVGHRTWPLQPRAWAERLEQTRTFSGGNERTNQNKDQDWTKIAHLNSFPV